MNLDQAGLRIAAVGPAVAAVGRSVGPDFFFVRSEMSGHVRTCPDIWRSVRHLANRSELVQQCPSRSLCVSNRNTYYDSNCLNLFVNVILIVQICL
jgi:hypothetical protein